MLVESRRGLAVEPRMHADPNLSDTRYLTAAVMRRLYAVPEEIHDHDEVEQLSLDETDEPAP